MRNEYQTLLFCQSHGYCSGGARCEFSHSIDVILDHEEKKMCPQSKQSQTDGEKKRRKRKKKKRRKAKQQTDNGGGSQEEKGKTENTGGRTIEDEATKAKEVEEGKIKLNGGLHKSNDEGNQKLLLQPEAMKDAKEQIRETTIQEHRIRGLVEWGDDLAAVIKGRQDLHVGKMHSAGFDAFATGT